MLYEVITARYRKEKRFKLFGLSAIVMSLLFLALLLGSIAAKGYSAFLQSEVLLDIHLDPQMLDVNNLARANYAALVRKARITSYNVCYTKLLRVRLTELTGIYTYLT